MEPLHHEATPTAYWVEAWEGDKPTWHGGCTHPLPNPSYLAAAGRSFRAGLPWLFTMPGTVVGVGAREPSCCMGLPYSLLAWRLEGVSLGPCSMRASFPLPVPLLSAVKYGLGSSTAAAGCFYQGWGRKKGAPVAACYLKSWWGGSRLGLHHGGAPFPPLAEAS